MKVSKLENMFKGWFVGNFEPTLLRTTDVEVAVKSYNKGYKDFFLTDHKIKIEDNLMTLSFDLYQGPKYFYRNIRWDGNEMFNDSTLTDAIYINMGDKFNNDQFNLSLFVPFICCNFNLFM